MSLCLCPLPPPRSCACAQAVTHSLSLSPKNPVKPHNCPRATKGEESAISESTTRAAGGGGSCLHPLCRGRGRRGLSADVHPVRPLGSAIRVRTLDARVATPPAAGSLLVTTAPRLTSSLLVPPDVFPCTLPLFLGCEKTLSSDTAPAAPHIRREGSEGNTRKSRERKPLGTRRGLLLPRS